ncbi:MAG: GNAT family N-acetyltransferase [Alphaproteobacteria bacterium]|nr:GNAT family N-acetyltransferase [Alphaproteobacteria bacterium]
MIEIDGREAGLVQILEAGFFGNLIHAVIVDRGPLWFEGFGSTAHFKAFTAELNRQFPRRFGRKRRFIPEIEDNPKTRNILKKNNFYPIGQHGYETIWVDLTQEENILMSTLKAQSRNKLRKAQKADLTIEWDEKGAYLPWLLTTYSLDKKEKSYDGPSVKLLQALGRTFLPKNMLIGRALINDKPVGAILILCHGSGATYQIGWSSQEGRKTAAHHRLLWDAFCVLKNKGIKDFDLGGVNDGTAKGVKQFKSGMGGHLVRLPGLYG